MMRKCNGVIRSPINENDIVSKSWIVFRHGIVAKLWGGKFRRRRFSHNIYVSSRGSSMVMVGLVIRDIGKIFSAAEVMAFLCLPGPNENPFFVSKYHSSMQWK